MKDPVSPDCCAAEKGDPPLRAVSRPRQRERDLPWKGQSDTACRKAMRIRHDHLKRLRVQAGWTQEEVGARCKIDVRTYRKYERGEVNKGLSGLEEFNRSDQYD